VSNHSIHAESGTMSDTETTNSHLPLAVAGADEAPTLAVLIPTLNRPHDLVIAVKTLLEQTRFPQELIIMDQSSSDESERQVRALFDMRPPKAACFELRYTRDPNIRSLALARNLLLDQNRCSIFLFLDDDVELEPEFVEKLMEAYAGDSGVTGISGIITNYKPGGFAARTWSHVFVHGPFFDDRQEIYYRANELREAGRIAVSRFTGALMSFRTDRTEGLRFDPNLKGSSEGEDVDYCQHLPAGSRIEIDPKVRLVHKASLAARKDEHWIASVVLGSSYVYYRNWRRGLRNRAAFAWLMCGFGILSLAASARRFSLAPWRSFITALQYGKKVGLGGN
jgi:GT2 family glycosyltransferase